jgi:hypothetical protein
MKRVAAIHMPTNSNGGMIQDSARESPVSDAVALKVTPWPARLAARSGGTRWVTKPVLPLGSGSFVSPRRLSPATTTRATLFWASSS